MAHHDESQDAKTLPTGASENASEGQNGTPKLPLEPERSSTAKSDALGRVEPPPTRRSTGPRTPQGKERSKHNALKHGIFSKVAVLKGEPRAEFDSLLSGLWEDRCPVGTLEEVLVEKLAVTLWRIRRVIIADSAPADWSTDFPGFPGVDRLLILRYEANLHRVFDRTLSQLERLQRIRLGQPVPPPMMLEVTS
jgi:hypothetical protein